MLKDDRTAIIDLLRSSARRSASADHPVEIYKRLYTDHLRSGKFNIDRFLALLDFKATVEWLEQEGIDGFLNPKERTLTINIFNADFSKAFLIGYWLLYDIKNTVTKVNERYTPYMLKEKEQIAHQQLTLFARSLLLPAVVIKKEVDAFLKGEDLKELDEHNVYNFINMYTKKTNISDFEIMKRLRQLNYIKVWVRRKSK